MAVGIKDFGYVLYRSMQVNILWILQGFDSPYFEQMVGTGGGWEQITIMDIKTPTLMPNDPQYHNTCCISAL